jgi:hypothetical protein
MSSANVKHTDSTHQNTIPVFKIKPERYSTNAIIKHVGYVKENEKIGDEIVILDKPIHPDTELYGKNAIPCKDVGNYNLVGTICLSNIIGSYIVMGTRYPLMYLNITYSKSLASGELCQFIISYDMDKEQKNEIIKQKNNSVYNNLSMKGKWTYHFDCDDEFDENYDGYVESLLKKEYLKEYVNDEDNKVDEEDINERMNKYVEENKTRFDKYKNTCEFNFETIEKTRDFFINMTQEDNFNDFMNIVLKGRETKRRKDMGVSDNYCYQIPKNPIDLDNIYQKILENDELISDSDDTDYSDN